MEPNRTRNPALRWSLAGAVLNLAGVVLLMVSLAGGLGNWGPVVFGSLITAGAACTVISLLISRRVIQLRSEDPRQ